MDKSMANSDQISQNPTTNVALPLPSNKLSLHSLHYQPATGIRPTPLPQGSQTALKMVQPVSCSSIQPSSSYVVCYAASTVNALKNPQQLHINSPLVQVVQPNSSMEPTQERQQLFVGKPSQFRSVKPSSLSQSINLRKGKVLTEHSGNQTSRQPQLISFNPATLQGNINSQNISGLSLQIPGKTIPQQAIPSLPMVKQNISQNMKAYHQAKAARPIFPNLAITSVQQTSKVPGTIPCSSLVIAGSKEDNSLPTSYEDDSLGGICMQDLINTDCDPPLENANSYTKNSGFNKSNSAVNVSRPPKMPVTASSIANAIIFTVAPAVSAAESLNEKPIDKVTLPSRILRQTTHSVPVSHASLLLSTTSSAPNENFEQMFDQDVIMTDYVTTTQASAISQGSGQKNRKFVFDTSVLLEKLNYFRNCGEYCDLTIEIKDTQWRCHSIVLAALSPVIHTAIQQVPQFRELNIEVRLPKELNEERFSMVLDMLYTGCITISYNTVEDLLLIASYLKITSLKESCDIYIAQMHSSNEDLVKKVSSMVTLLPGPISNRIKHPDKERDEQKEGRDNSKRESKFDSSESDAEGALHSSCYKAQGDDVSNVEMHINKANTSDLTEKSTSSLTNLMRVASEAFKDLDHEDKTLEQKDCDEIIEKQSSEEMKDGKLSKEDPNDSHGSDNEKNRCKICRKTFRSPGGLSSHVRMCHQKKRYSCSYCNKVFAKTFDCRLHEQRKHTKEKPHKCSECGKAFHIKRELHHHLKTHKDRFLQGCSICNKTFESEAGYKYHMASHGEKTHACRHPLCNSLFASVLLRNRHEKSHSTSKPFHCEQCERSFRSKHELVRHCRTHSGEKPYKCDICGKTFTRVDHMKIHKNSHTEERNYKCSYCNKTFKQQSGLNLHKQKHMESLSFVCDVCGFKCHTRSYLREHSITHTSDRPFHCEICFARFKSKRYLARHKKIHKSRGETNAEEFEAKNQKRNAVRAVSEKVKKISQSIPSTLSSAIVVMAKPKAESSKKQILPKVLNIITPDLQPKSSLGKTSNNLTGGEQMDSLHMSNICSYLNVPPLPASMSTSFPKNSEAILQQGENSGTIVHQLQNFTMFPSQNSSLRNSHTNTDGCVSDGRDLNPLNAWDGTPQPLDGALDTVSMELAQSDRQYLPVLTEEEILNAENDPGVHFPEE